MSLQLSSPMPMPLPAVRIRPKAFTLFSIAFALMALFLFATHLNAQGCILARSPEQSGITGQGGILRPATFKSPSASVINTRADTLLATFQDAVGNSAVR